MIDDISTKCINSRYEIYRLSSSHLDWVKGDSDVTWRSVTILRIHTADIAALSFYKNSDFYTSFLKANHWWSSSIPYLMENTTDDMGLRVAISYLSIDFLFLKLYVWISVSLLLVVFVFSRGTKLIRPRRSPSPHDKFTHLIYHDGNI